MESCQYMHRSAHGDHHVADVVQMRIIVIFFSFSRPVADEQPLVRFGSRPIPRRLSIILTCPLSSSHIFTKFRSLGFGSRFLAIMALMLSAPRWVLPSPASAHSVEQKGGGSHVLAQLSSYGIPSYGAPRPYQTPGADFHNDVLRPAETVPNPSFGDRNLPDLQWSYKSPADYSTPVSYRTPKGYKAPKAYSRSDGTELGAPGVGLDDVKKEEDLGGGNGGRGGGGDNGGRGGGGGDGGEEAKKKLAGLSLSQKLTLAYAALVGVGGIMGFVKTGSSKSLMAGGLSASILYYVFLNLPTKPIMSSIIGLGIAGMLLFVMGSRFSETGKVFPAGVVSLYSLVMTGGYIHGIVRGH